MGGASLGSMFGGPSTIGSNKYAPANTTPSVMGAQGKLEAFNPTTMAGTYNSTTPTPTMSNFTGAGLDASSGLPTYVTNFLQQGGTGTLAAPQFTMEGTGVEAAGAQASQKMQKAPNIPIAPGGVPPPKKTTTAATTPAAATTGAKGPITQVLGNNGGSQPLYVNDQWNFQTGTSQPMATPALGGPSANQGGQAPLYKDSGGNYFYDAGGTQPVTGPALQQFKNMFG